MEKKNCSELSNSEIKLHMVTLENEYEALKAKMIALCDEMDEIDREYAAAENELKIRRTIY